MQVYRAACHYSDSEAETDMALRITSSRAFNRIMVFTLREVGFPGGFCAVVLKKIVLRASGPWICRPPGSCGCFTLPSAVTGFTVVLLFALLSDYQGMRHQADSLCRHMPQRTERRPSCAARLQTSGHCVPPVTSPIPLCSFLIGGKVGFFVSLQPTS